MYRGNPIRGSNPLLSANKKVSFVYRTKETFLCDAFLAECDAHCVRDADIVCDVRFGACGTHRITYHSAAASLITCLQINRICDTISKSEVCMMSESKLRDLSMEFSVDIIELARYLKSIKESIISNQIGRSGTSIGANIHEAQYAQGKKDFISKLEIALKEASETGYWLELLYRTKYIDEQTFKTLSAKCTSLRAMLIASCRTAKENAK